MSNGHCSVLRVQQAPKERLAPLAQLVEQLTLNQWVLGSSPRRCTKWPVGQVVKTAASHAVNIGSNPVRVTNSFLTACAKPFTIEEVLRRNLENEVGAD